MTNSKIMTSRMKTLFPEELIKLLSAVCDTTRIARKSDKIDTIHRLLKKYDIRADDLGGATNRMAVYTDMYCYKIALDTQGYRDNLIEYSLSQELQPYVTKSYETNGYILISECVKPMTRDDFRLRKSDIIKVLDIIGRDYLLGDVGYTPKNFANWGIRDDNSVVILDYAYIHRGTQNLFICDVCGEGVLAYDASYTYLRCTNSTVCNAKFDYLERKVIQGYQVDLDMIEEKKNDSIVIKQGETCREVISDDGFLNDGRVKVVRTQTDYEKYLEEKNMISKGFDRADALDAIIEKTVSTDPDVIKKAEETLDNMKVTDESETIYVDENGNPIDEVVEEVEEEPDEDENEYGSIEDFLSGITLVSSDVSVDGNMDTTSYNFDDNGDIISPISKPVKYRDDMNSECYSIGHLINDMIEMSNEDLEYEEE